MASSHTKLLIGAHTSASGGVHNALLQGKEIGATTIQLFTANQRTWNTKPLTAEAVSLWEEAKEETGIDVVMSHDSYLINLGAIDKEVLHKSRHAFHEELSRCLLLNINYLNFHPGAHTTSSREECLETIIESLLEVAPLASKGKTKLLIETTAGQGSTIGAQFEEIGYLISRTKDKLPIGVCIDTCHIFAAGYDIRTKEGWDKTLAAFDEKVGLSYLHAMHINDSLKPLGSRADRHASLGKGQIGLPSFQALMHYPKLHHIPKYLETPDPALWPQEIDLLTSYAEACHVQ
jgi:deoxyribonuclease-4